MAIQMIYCEEKDHELVWFCHDVEEVFLGKRVPDSQKVQEAGTYRRKNGIREMYFNKLSEKTVRPHTSNLMCILDKYLTRK